MDSSDIQSPHTLSDEQVAILVAVVLGEMGAGPTRPQVRSTPSETMGGSREPRTPFPTAYGITGAFVIADSFFYSSHSRIDYSILEPFVGVRLQINFR